MKKSGRGSRGERRDFVAQMVAAGAKYDEIKERTAAEFGRPVSTSLIASVKRVVATCGVTPRADGEVYVPVEPSQPPFEQATWSLLQVMRAEGISRVTLSSNGALEVTRSEWVAP